MTNPVEPTKKSPNSGRKRLRIRDLSAPHNVRGLSELPVLTDKADWIYPWIEDAAEHERVVTYEYYREAIRIADLLLRLNHFEKAANRLRQRFVKHDFLLTLAGHGRPATAFRTSMQYLMAIHKDSRTSEFLPPPSESCRDLLRKHYGVISEGRTAACSLRPLTRAEMVDDRHSWTKAAQSEFLLTINQFVYPPPRMSEVLTEVKKQLKKIVEDDLGGRPPGDLLFLSYYRFSMGTRKTSVSHGKGYIDELLSAKLEMTATSRGLYASCLGYEKPEIANKTWYAGVRIAGRRINKIIGLILENFARNR